MKKIVLFLVLLFLFLPAQNAISEEFEITHDSAIEAIAKGKAKEALKYYESKGDEFFRAKNWYDAADAYTIASSCARALADYNKAIKLTKKAVKIYEENLPEQDFKASVAYANLGGSYYAIGAYQKALSALEKGLKKIERYDGEKNQKYIHLRINIFNHIGQIERLKKNYSSALIYHLKGMEGYETLYTIQSKWKRGPYKYLRIVYIWGLWNLSKDYINLKDYKNAEKQLNEAINYRKKWGVEKELEWLDPQYSFDMGEIAYNKKEYNKALNLYLEGLEKAEKIKGQNLFALKTYLNGNIGRGYLIKKDYASAEKYYKDGIYLIESMRGSLESSELRSAFFERMTGIYRGMITALINQGKYEEGFNYSERVRARTFLDILGGKTSLYKGKNKSLADEEIRLKSKLAYLKEMSNKNLKFIQNLKKTEDEYRDFLKKIEAENPEQASLMSVSPLTLKEVQSYLDNSTVILEYFVGNKETFLWVLEKDKLNFKRIPVSSGKMKELVNAYKDAVTNVKPLHDVKKKGASLYNTLIKPVEQYIKGKELIIIPHQVLHYLPFHSLVTGNGRFLIEEYSVRYLSSGSVLKFITVKDIPFNGKGAVFGNPDFGDIGGRLRYAEREANEIKKFYPASDLFLAKNANIKNTGKITEIYSLVHFAAHSELDENNPLESGIKLAGEGGEYQDYLKVKDLFSWNIKMSLVVLSACETGIGEVTSGDEIVSLTRAFIYAGTPSVIATLWQVNDRASYLLMKEFYRNLKSNNKAESLRKAQLKVAEEYPHPYFWAGYFLSGAK